jgi:hypothetical protein
MNVNIIGTVGKIEDGILVLIDIEYDGILYECSYWYNDTTSLITTPDSLDFITDLKSHSDYNKIKEYLLKTLEPYDIAINKVDALDIN